MKHKFYRTKITDYYQKREEQMRKCFKEHKADFSTQHPVRSLEWKKPDDSNYAVWYMTRGRNLIVVGDLGEAIYSWGQVVTFEWIAGCNLDYFASKCEASEVGRRFKGWDGRLGNELIRDMKDNDPELYAKLVEHLDIEHNGLDRNQREWEQRIVDSGYDITDDCETLSMLSSIGEVIHQRCQLHHLGIKMAVAIKEAALDGKLVS